MHTNSQYIFVDTSSLIQLAHAAITIDHGPQISQVQFNSAHTEDHQLRFRKRIDAANQIKISALKVSSLESMMHDLLAGGRKLILTRRQFQELFSTVSGSLDLLKEAGGTLSIPLGVNQCELRKPDAMILYNLFEDYAKKGALRCYASVDDFIQASDKGIKSEIVIIDNEESKQPYPGNGRMIHENADYWKRANSGNAVEKNRKEFFNSGDNEFIKLIEHIRNYSLDNHQPFDPMIVCEDNGLNDLLREDQLASPKIFRALELIWGMHVAADASVNEETAKAYSDAINIRSIIGRGPKKVNPVDFRKNVYEAANWLSRS